MHTYARGCTYRDDIWKKRFSGITSHIVWNGKTKNSSLKGLFGKAGGTTGRKAGVAWSRWNFFLSPQSKPHHPLLAGIRYQNSISTAGWKLRACLHGRGGPHLGEVTCGGSPHLSYKRDQIKMRDYVDRRVTHQSGLPHLPGVPHLHVNRP